MAKEFPLLLKRWHHPHHQKRVKKRLKVLSYLYIPVTAVLCIQSVVKISLIPLVMVSFGVNIFVADDESASFTSKDMPSPRQPEESQEDIEGII